MVGKEIKLPFYTRFHPKQLMHRCRDCLFGEFGNCPKGVEKLCATHYGWKRYGYTNMDKKSKDSFDKINFLEIISDENYFTIDEDKNRTYIYCQECGYIPYSEIDYETEFLDLHCKCGSFATWAEFTDEEIMQIAQDEVERDIHEQMFGNPEDW